MASAYRGDIHRKPMGSDHPHFCDGCRGYCLLPREDDIHDKGIFYDRKYSLTPNLFSEYEVLMKNTFPV